MQAVQAVQAAQASQASHETPETPPASDLPQLVRYLWGNDPTPQPTYTADLTAVELTDLSLPGNQDIGYYIPRMPFGKVYVYPEYLVFLTESHNKPGQVPGLDRILPVLLDAWRAVMFWRPLRVARTVYQRITKDELDRLRKPLGNPNSLVVPLSEIRGFTVKRWMLTSYLVLTTDDREILLAPNQYLGMLATCPAALLSRSIRLNAMGIFGLPWQTQLVAALQRTEH